ncbi:hypothetical protein GQ53DRAFT_750548 [Thozetella sp. PMI_491]|nr:hypothetical protein GQ53DRAFT_750548 [Thozetella sp. PMI_491]
MMQTKYLLSFLLPSVAVAAVMPPINPAERSDSAVVRDSGCTTGKHWRGGSCKFDWAGRCFGTCSQQASSYGCCSGSVSSEIQGCALGWSSCECWCNTH